MIQQNLALETSKELCNFFRKAKKKIQKIIKKNKKNIENSNFFKNKAGYMFCLTYAFSSIFFYNVNLKKNYFLKFGQFLKSPPDSGDGDGDGDCDRHGEF